MRDSFRNRTFSYHISERIGIKSDFFVRNRMFSYHISERIDAKTRNICIYLHALCLSKIT